MVSASTKESTLAPQTRRLTELLAKQGGFKIVELNGGLKRWEKYTKIPIYDGWELRLLPWLRKPLCIYVYIIITIIIMIIITTIIMFIVILLYINHIEDLYTLTIWLMMIRCIPIVLPIYLHRVDGPMKNPAAGLSDVFCWGFNHPLGDAKFRNHPQQDGKIIYHPWRIRMYAILLMVSHWPSIYHQC